MTISGKRVVIVLVSAILALVGAAAFTAYGAISWLRGPPDMPHIAELFADAAERGDAEVTLPNFGGQFLLATPYCPRQEKLEQDFGISPAEAWRIERNSQQENMHIFHIVDGACVGWCVLDARFCYENSLVQLVPSGHALSLGPSGSHRPILITTAPPTKIP